MDTTSRLLRFFPPPGTTILVVEDDPESRALLKKGLDIAGCTTAGVGSCREARAHIAAHRPDIVLLDITLPDENGFTLLGEIRASSATRTLPVILVTVAGDSADVVRGLSAGANDYMVKPVDFPVLLARIASHLNIASLVAQLEHQTHVLAELAALDELTGIFNRRALFKLLGSEIDRAIRNNRPLAIMMLDLDFFKKVNDEHGHLVGDTVLREFAERTADALRNSDIFARYGGEEFVALLPETMPDGAMRVAERVRKAVAGARFGPPEARTSLTVSIGVATLNATVPKETNTAEVFVERADRALLAAKADGRNCCRMADGGQ